MHRLLILFALATPRAQAATLVVGPTGSHATLAQALGAAQDGDLVQVQAGTYSESVVVTVDVDLVALGLVEITGRDTTLVRFDGVDATLTGFVLRPDGGRGIRVDGGQVQVNNTTISGNRGTSFDGAGAAVFGGSLTLRNVTLEDNATAFRLFPVRTDGVGGHALAVDAELQVIDSTLRLGEARRGGGIHASGGSQVTLTDVVFEDLQTSDDGAGIWLGDSATLVAQRVSFRRMDASGDGGALYWDGARGVGSVDLVDVDIHDARSNRFGGGIAVFGGGALRLTRVSIEAATSRDGGGGLSVEDVTTLALADFDACDTTTQGAGGALRVRQSQEASVVRATIRSAAAGSAGGGAIACQDAPLRVSQSDLLLNRATGPGGAIGAERCGLVVRNSLIAWTGAGHGVAADGADLAWNAWFSNAPGNTTGGPTPGVGAVQADPLLPRFARSGACSDDDTRRAPDSPLVDAGDPGVLDPDGSTSDIGANGGPDADPELWEDDDRDGVIALYDCNDRNQRMTPGAAELCDGLDNDCDGVVDGPNASPAPIWFPDLDDDGWGDAAASGVTACVAPAGHVERAFDCDDDDDDVNPGQPEVCNGKDDNCDGRTDGTDAAGQLTWFEDVDGDGFGNPNASQVGCTQPSGHILAAGDCDDSRADVRPGGEERCDGIDGDCDGRIDAPNPVDGTLWYPDGDGDGFGGQGEGMLACSRPEGFGRAPDDCDDANADIHPRAPESCEQAVDANCDGFTGDDDNDGDGFPACEDCDDGDPSAYPSAPETWYDGLVQDCTSASDFDADRDGAESDAYGGTDCDDTDAAIGPGAEEIGGNGIDENCDGEDGEAPYDYAYCGGCANGRPHAWTWTCLVLLALRRRRV